MIKKVSVLKRSYHYINASCYKKGITLREIQLPFVNYLVDLNRIIRKVNDKKNCNITFGFFARVISIGVVSD